MNYKFISLLSSLLFIFVLGNVFDANSASAKPLDFIKKIMTEDSRAIRRLSKSIPSNKFVKTLRRSDIHKQLPEINLDKLTPDIIKIASVGRLIVSKGKRHEQFLNQVSSPQDVIRQYGNYGDDYLKVILNSGKTIQTHLSNVILRGAKGVPDFSTKKLESFKSPDFSNNKLVDILKRTGKRGFQTVKQISIFASENQKSTASAGLLLWFMIDPEGMLDSVQDISAFLTKASLGTGGAIVNGVGQGTMEMFQQIITEGGSNFLFGGVVISILMLFFFPFARKLFFFPLLLLKRKIENVIDAKERSMKTQNTTGDSNNVASNMKNNNNRGVF